jgi:transcriptional regulator with XRE-family HTH domain
MTDLRTWLDAQGLSAEKAAAIFGVEAQTIRNWRSSGVPERRRLQVEQVMANYKPPETGMTLDATITIHPTWEQLQCWMDAARSVGKSPLEWAQEGLDAMARELLPDYDKAAEDPPANGYKATP